MEKEIEKILNQIYYLDIIVKFEEFGKYSIIIENMNRKITYKLNFKIDNKENIKKIEKLIDEEIVKYYKMEEK